MPQYYLTDRDREILSEIYEFVKRNRIRGSSNRNPDPDDANSAPDVYVVKTPSTGIGAIYEPTGTGSSPEASYASCQIYTLVYNPDTRKTYVVAVPGLTAYVYNLGETAAEGNKWCLVNRIKQGYWVLTESTGGGGGGGGGGGCCGDETNTEYHPTDAPFTTTFDIYRPFGTGSATTSGISCSWWGDWPQSRQAVDLPDWTHVMVCPIGTDIRDGCTRLIGNNGLTYADGDEVRIPSGASSPRFVVVFVESVNKGLSGPDLYEYKRVFMMRHTA